MATTKVYIANAALDLIGQTQIISLDDAVPAAVKSKLHIDQAIREVLQSGKWKPAMKEQQLPQLTAAPAFGYTYAYQMPADYLRMHRINDVDPNQVLEEQFEIIGQVLNMDASPVYLSYVSDLTMSPNNIGVSSPLMVEVMAIKLATKLAWFFQMNADQQKMLEQMYAMKLRKALSVDSLEIKTSLRDPEQDSRWLQNRLQSTNN